MTFGKVVSASERASERAPHVNRRVQGGIIRPYRAGGTWRTNAPVRTVVHTGSRGGPPMLVPVSVLMLVLMRRALRPAYGLTESRRESTLNARARAHDSKSSTRKSERDLSVLLIPVFPHSLGVSLSVFLLALSFSLPVVHLLF